MEDRYREYIGIDVGKDSLDVKIGEVLLHISNDAKGHNALLKRLAEYPEEASLLMVCEASGGYEKSLVNLLMSKNYPVHVAHGNHVRSFAKARGYLAKTDKMDAALLQDYAKTLKPAADISFHTQTSIELGDYL